MAARRLDVSDPFAQSGLLDRVRVLSRQDCTSDESWRFAPVGVLSHVERDFGNAAQVSNFARAFDLPLIRWRLPLMPEARALLEELSDEDLDRLYAAEPALWGYFCEGAPLLIPESIRSTRKLVNGSPGLLYSLVYEGNTVPPEVLGAQRQGGHVVIDLDVAPVGVMARMSGARAAARAGAAAGAAARRACPPEALSATAAFTDRWPCSVGVSGRAKVFRFSLQAAAHARSASGCACCVPQCLR
jgi:hypothetical protein